MAAGKKFNGLVGTAVFIIMSDELPCFLLVKSIFSPTQGLNRTELSRNYCYP